ncbi:MAG TPA: hypothetical protein VGE94_03630 [Chloroflexota bacterium]
MDDEVIADDFALSSAYLVDDDFDDARERALNAVSHGRRIAPT